jgi:hypothetical protein
LAIKLDIQKPEDWFRVTRKTVLEENRFINSYYNGSLAKGIILYLPSNSLSKALKAAYPEHQHVWQHWRTNKPKRHWNVKENQRKFFDELAVKYNIQKPEDWYTITMNMIKGGGFINTQYGGSLIQGNLNYNWVLTIESGSSSLS